jgi:hypothetical protein
MNGHLFLLPLSGALAGMVLAPLALRWFATPRRVRRIAAALTPGILPLADTHVDDFLRNKLPKAMPVMSMLVGEKTIAQLKAVFMEELQNLLPEFAERCAGKLAARLIYKAVLAGFLAGASIGALQMLLGLLVGPSGLVK